jgi:dTDP-4-dehydrorhamnose 3,5-epimerase
MTIMNIVKTTYLSISGPTCIFYKRFCDDRGYFSEHFRESQFCDIIPGFAVKQTNESFSKKNTLRGLHTQWQPQMGKLVRTVHGHMWDIILDIRCDSSTFGQVAVIDMPAHSSEETNMWLWVPPGFAHGNFFLEDTTIEYFCTAEYAGPANEVSLSPFANDLDWASCAKEKGLIDNVRCQLVQSVKDSQGLSLAQWQQHHAFTEFKGLV